MLRQNVRLLSAFVVLFSLACARQPTQPTENQSAGAGATAATCSTGCTEPSLHLAIEPNNLTIGDAVVTDGRTRYPIKFTTLLTETAGVPITLSEYRVQVRSAAGIASVVPFSGSVNSTWSRALPGGTTWKVQDTAYVAERKDFGKGMLTVLLRATDPTGTVHGLTASATVQ